MGYLGLIIRVFSLAWIWVLMKKLGKKYPPSIITFVLLFVSALILLPFAAGDFVFDLHVLMYAIFASLFYSVGFYLYTWSFSKGEASLVAPLYNINIFFLLVIAVLFLGESFSVFKLAGTGILFYGVLYLQNQDKFLVSMKKVLANKPCRYMIIASFFMACGRAVDRSVVIDFPYHVYALYIESLMSAVMFVMILVKGDLKFLKQIYKEDFGFAIYAGVVSIISYGSSLLALTFIEVTIVEPIVLFSALVMVVMGKYIFHEQIKARLVGTLIMIAGTVLLFF